MHFKVITIQYIYIQYILSDAQTCIQVKEDTTNVGQEAETDGVVGVADVVPTYSHIHTHTHTHKHTRTYTHTHTYIYTHTRTHTYIHTLYTHILTHTHTYIHTHILTQIFILTGLRRRLCTLLLEVQRSA